MGMTSFRSFVQEHKELLESELLQYVDCLSSPDVLKEAMKYSLEAGGKRIRPLLVFSVLQAFGKPTKIGLPAACAIEMIHTYSLIHDDLPSMDNDDLRRGKPTNHIIFGEANAILAGDALLTLSFQLLAKMDDPSLSADQKIEIINEIAKSAGAEGMVGGQTADMTSEGKSITLDELEYIHEHKTGKLLVCSVMTGAILAGANELEKDKLRQFAHHLGLAFQIRDDILDIEGNEEKIGKRIGSDQENNKNTYPSLLTLDGAKEKLREEIELAMKSLSSIKINPEHLINLTNLVANREG